MVKYGLIVLILVSILFLGLTRPDTLGDPRRDPVPSTQKVAHSSHCAGCHGFDETGKALVDNDGNDVSIYNDWQISMMGLSARDPFWRATLAHEVSHYPTAKNAIESTCLKCHAPLGSIQARLTAQQYSFEMMLADSLGQDGVSCSSCHQQPAQNLGKGHSGNFTIDTNRVFFGPFPNPFQGPMQIYVGFDPVFSDHIYLSGVCAGCHTLITETLLDDGTPSGNFFVEQATYHEWLNSIYPAQGKECQTCHMPFIEDSVVIATDFLVHNKRHPFGLHQFFGANTAMLDMMKANKKLLGMPSGPPDEAWDESINNNRISLGKAAELTMSSMIVQNDTLYINLIIKNKSGHKLPSGYPSRLSWLQIILKDDVSNDTLYTNGLLDEDGNIEGRDLPYEPHHQVSKSSADVQIYEMVMSDLQGHLTTRLNAAHQPLKDNRLLPVGFSQNHSTYDTVAIWGEANLDPDYSIESTFGRDRIEYRIPLNGADGIADLDISIRYHALPSRWMNDLLSHDTIAHIALFKSIYKGYERFDEVMDQLLLEDIDLSTVAIPSVIMENPLLIFPNPVYDNLLHIDPGFVDQYMGDLRYEIVDLNGKKLQSGLLDYSIPLHPTITQGVFFFLLYQQNRLIRVKPFTVL